MTARQILLCIGTVILVGCGDGGGDGTSLPDKGWVGSWSAAPYGPYPAGPLTGTVPEPISSLTTPGAFDNDQARDQSFRMIVNPSLGGELLRVRLSNLVGDRPIRFEPVRIALRAAHLPLGSGLGAGAAILPQTDTAVLFDGQPHIIIEPGAEAISDPVALPFAAGEDLVISFQLVGDSGPMTWHAVSFDTQFIAGPDSGDRTGDVSGLGFAYATVGWFFLSGIDVLRPDSPGAVVMLGDSITDGAYQVPATDTRMPDAFARRLQAAGVPMGVLNQGINSNRVTGADDSPERGPSALGRFDRDVLERAGVRSVLIFEGTNDLSAGVDAPTVYSALQELIQRAREAGLCVVLGTIPPRDDILFGWTRATDEPERQALNALIRSHAEIDGIADFDTVLGSSLDPSRPNPLLYFPDLLHPNSLGFIAMADAIPLEALVPPPAGTCERTVSR